ncbi:hypothetical protein HNY73_010503 [Argiope bruennichi]|uniref:Uncharacterized protein n=1 Tax=Argiope bruennichi TaxID=94029 RepID=A0A8T0F235_ARGBR|nr:hypothetical protein HNY73_010503 [Argiope bruennichi]
MAAGYNGKIILKNEEAISDGHRVLIDFEVDNLAAKETFDLKQDHITRCEVLPTSWKFRMMFRRVSANGIVNIPVSLKRFDSMPYQVNASISVLLSDGRNQSFLAAQETLLSLKWDPVMNYLDT